MTAPVLSRLLRRLALTTVLTAAATARGADGWQGQPLAPVPGATSTMGFTRLDPAQTGLVAENRFADPRMWGDRYQELTYGAIGTGVTIGDYDQDGRPDVFVVSKTETSRLFRNLGNWRFADVTDDAGLAGPTGVWERGLAWVREWWNDDETAASGQPWSQGATFVDLDNDGDLDLYVCRFAAPNQLFVNQGDGTFTEEAATRGLAIVDASGMAAFADFDRDGWLDVYLQTNLLDANRQPDGRADYLLRNTGQGRFEDVTRAAGIRGESAGHSVTWWDYDGDGWPDIYVANDFATPDRLYRNGGDGTFTDVLAEVVPVLPYYAMGADVGDVNNDGRIDFLVADMAATSHVKDQRGMAGSRARAQQEPADPAQPPQLMRNALYLATGTGRVLEAAQLAGVPASDWTWSVRFEDLDNDGRVDLHVTNGMNREYHNADLLARIMAGEDPGAGRRIMRESPPLAEANLAFRNTGDLTFEPVGRAWGLDERGVSFGAAFGDLDGDGDLDLVYGNYEAGPTLLRNDAPDGHRLIVALQGQQSNRHGIGALVQVESKTAGRQVRPLTLARGYLSSSEPIAHFGLGADATVDRLTVRWPSGQVQVLEDLPANQRLTITEPSGPPPAPGPRLASPALYSAVTDEANLRFTVATEPTDPAKQQPLVPVDLNRLGPALAVGDLNGDGRDDLVVAGSTLAPAQVRWAQEDGRFASAALAFEATGRPVEDGPLLVFDANADGAADVLLTSAGVRAPAGDEVYQPRLWLNQGPGQFAPAPAGALPAFPVSVGAVAAADYDRDGDLDTFIGGRSMPGEYPRPAPSALWRNDGGRFADVTTLAPGLERAGLVTAALWSDVDGDGWIDLLVALEWGGIRYWRNLDGNGFADESADAGFASAGPGWWTSLAAGDFNQDGRPDYLAGNVGLNTPYTATPEAPAVTYLGDFTGRGRPLLIEGRYDRDRLYPRRTRGDLVERLPALARRFPRTDVFARTELNDVLGAEAVAAAERFTATEFRSGVFLSQPDGQRVFTPLPRLAQLAPLQGMVTGDFDGDGRLDLYAVQNSSAPIAAVGRFTGGLSLLLRGDGAGGFTPVPPAASGLVVPGDAEALVLVPDSSPAGWTLVTSRHRESLLAHRPTAPGKNAGLRLRLQGPAGNPTAIGARVTLEGSEGPPTVAEVYSSSSYLSQSAPVLFLSLPERRADHQLRVRWPDGRETVHPVPEPTVEGVTWLRAE